MNKFGLLLILFLIGACSGFKSKKTNKINTSVGEKFSYVDKNGKYLIKLSSGINTKDNTYFLKKTIEIPNLEKDNILEQQITISEIGKVKKINVLRPKQSQYTVWFEGKKYFSELKILPKKKSVEVKMQSPEASLNGTKIIKFPTTKLISCFFSQIIECINTTGYFETVSKNKKSKINLLIIWEGYPFLNETYSDFPTELFSKAFFEYEGKVKENEYRYNLSVAGQSVFYVIDNDKKFKKMFWVSQGITMLAKTNITKEEETSADGEDSE